MKKFDRCPSKTCVDGVYTHGTGIYDFFSCGHAWEKPLADADGEGCLVQFKSPYSPYKELYENDFKKKARKK